MCGKDETVELLLDKGVNLDLKDGRGRTVLDVLEEYTAEQAVKIKTMIQGGLLPLCWALCQLLCGVPLWCSFVCMPI